MIEKEVVLEVKNLKKYFPASHKRVLKAVDDVSFTIHKGETFGIVGESGCGKTTCGKTCTGILTKTDGQVLYQGKDVHQMSKAERNAFTQKVQTIFQDPYASLDPHQKVYQIVSEGMRIHHLTKSKEEEQKRVMELLEMVGLNAEHATRNVHEFSGGQRQRIGIARALAVNPEFLFCDEPISALDVSIQAQVVNMLEDLQEELGLTYLFVAHDLSMVRHISTRIGVMYLGKIVEIAESDELYDRPFHPYTEALLSAIPVADPKLARSSKRKIIKGDLPSPMDVPGGCRFHTRCPYAKPECGQMEPPLVERTPGHFVACHIR